MYVPICLTGMVGAILVVFIARAQLRELRDLIAALRAVSRERDV